MLPDVMMRDSTGRQNKQRFSEGNAGWDGRDRTSEWRNQNPLPYRLATSHCVSGLLVCLSADVKPLCFEFE